MIVQTVTTKNDTNGNPRRLDLVWSRDDGRLLMVWNHGYRGPMERTPGIYVDIGSLEIPPSEYNALRRLAKDDGIYHAN